MQITVFGASGKVGRLVVDEALARGHSVVVFVHNRSPFKNVSNLKIVKGDVRDKKSVGKALKGSDAVISALGSWGTPDKNILIIGMQNIIPAMDSAGIKRIVSLTGHGANAANDGFEPLHIFSRWILKLLAPKILFDGEEHIKLLEASRLDWTVLRSSVMSNHLAPVYTVTNKRPLPLAVINRRAVAKCLLDFAESETYIRQSPFLVRKRP